MRRIMAGDDVARLARSAERLVRLAQAINERAKEWEEPTAEYPHSPVQAAGAGTDQLIQAARAAILLERKRPDFGIPELFQRKSWSLVLELFIADCGGTDIPVKVACLSVGGSQSSALRCILDLERCGIIESRADPSDGRRRLLSLSPRTRRDLQSYLSATCEEGRAPIRVALRMTTCLAPEAPINFPDAAGAYELTPTSAQSESGTETVSQ